ncbi:MAG: benzoate-CoA ligase family protein [Acidobacteriota bacterium]
MVEFPEQFNMATYFLESNLAAGRGDKVCLYYQDKTYTYRQIAEETNRVGNVLRELGVEMEDRVLMVLSDCPEFVASWFAITKIGAVITMVNHLLPTTDYQYYLDYTRAKVAIVEASALERIEPALQHARHLKSLLVVGTPTGRHPSYAELVREASLQLDTAATTRDDIAIWLFTSGSTGHPKAAVHLQHDLPYNTECYAKQVLKMSEHDITLGVPKLFFGYATGTNLLFPFAVGGATAIFSERSTAETMFEMIARYRPTVLTSVPTMINAMLQVEGAQEKYDLSCLRVCISAGEALPEELYHRWVSTFGVEILDGIGSAEMFHIYISNCFGDVKPGSLGKLVPGYDARIIDAEGREVSIGEMGTLQIKGDSAALCYWNAHEKSKQTFAGDWYTSSDQFRRDQDGYFWYCGRTDDMLKVGGIFVSPIEIENCLLQHEAVAECAVIGIMDEQNLIKSKAFIVVRAGVEADNRLVTELQEFVKRTIAPYKYPRIVEFVASLPKNDRGKIDRKLLKAGDN